MKIFVEQRKSGVPWTIYIVAGSFIAGAALMWWLKTPADNSRRTAQTPAVAVAERTPVVAVSAAPIPAPAPTTIPVAPPVVVQVATAAPVLRNVPAAIDPPPPPAPLPPPPLIVPAPRVVPPLVPDKPVPSKPALPIAPRGAVGMQVDLMKLIVLATDAASGPWRMRNNILEYPAPMKYGILKIRYTPGEQYDFRAVFMRTSGDDDIGFHIVSGNKRALFSVCGWHNTLAGFHGINGKDVDSDANPTKTANGIENNKEYKLLVQVRKASIRVFLNDKELMNYKFTKQEFTGVDGMPVSKSDPILGVYCSSVTAKFSVLEVIELPPAPVEAGEKKSPDAPF